MIKCLKKTDCFMVSSGLFCFGCSQCLYWAKYYRHMYWKSVWC